jgi:hypothetical protein
MFPFVPGMHELYIKSMALLFDQPEHCDCECPGECPCCADPSCSHHDLLLRRRGAKEREFRCEASEEWPRGYHGIVDCVTIGPLHGRREHEEVRIVFPPTVEKVESAYLLCRYVVRKYCDPKKPRTTENHVPHEGADPPRSRQRELT